MKNIIHIDMTNDGTCDLLSSADTGDNSVILDVTVDTGKNPTLEIYGNTVTITESPFEYTIPSSYYIGDGVLQFRFTDDDHTGDYFQIAKVAEVDGNLYLKRVSDFIYELVNVKNDMQRIVDMIYPVGSIYMSVNSTSPATLFGGTWVAWGSGRVPVGIDKNDEDFNTVEKAGGDKLLQSHNHSGTIGTGYSNFTRAVAPGTGAPAAYGNNHIAAITDQHGDYIDYENSGNFVGMNHTHNITIGNTGGGNSGNLQPYITCYMWKRTA